MVSNARGFVAVILLCVSFGLQAAINSHINHSMIDQGDSIQLSIDMADASADQVDLKPLEQDFQVLGRSQQSSTIIRNGRIESSTELVITLLPKRVGDLQVPALNIGSEQTQSHALRVTAVQQPSAVDGGIEMLSTISSQQPKVQQPLVYQTSLLLGRQIFNATLQGPEIKTGQALIESLGEQRQYQQTLNGRQITVVEQTWLITPEQSGPLTISPAMLVGQVETGRQSRSPFGGSFSNPADMRRIQVSAEGYQLDVEPIPASFSGQRWLPAENLTLTENWSSDQFMVGEPLTRTIKLHAEGVSRHQIAELALPDIDGIKQYASTPEVGQTYENDILTSTLTLEVTLIPERTGKLLLPEILIPWWDVKSNSEKTAVLAARSIDVVAGKNIQRQSVAAPASASSPSSATKPQGALDNSLTDPVLLSAEPASDVSIQSMPLNPASVPSEQTLPVKINQSISIWWVALFGALVGSVATLMIVWLIRKRSHQQSVNPAAETASSTHPSLSSLKAACHSNNAAAARLALIAWGQQFWPKCSNLNQLSLKVSPELQQAIADLHKHSYSQKADQAEECWKGAALWEAVQAFKGKEATNKKPTDKLAPMFLS